MSVAPRLLLTSPLLVLLAGCPIQDESADDSATVTLNMNDVPCSSVQPTPGDFPADVRHAPRADPEAEQLAFEASCAIAAPENVYERVTTELAAIRAAHPEVRGITASQPYEPFTLLVGLDEAGEAAWQAGSYTAWNSLNQAYGAAIGRLGSGFLLEFGGLYNLPLLASQYQQLPQVRYAEMNLIARAAVMPNPVINDACLALNGSDHHYLFVSGALIKGGFRVDAAGAIARLDPKQIVAANPPPAWYTRCIAWLR